MSSNIIFLVSNLTGDGAQRIVVSVANSVNNSKLVTIYNTPSAYASSAERVSLSSFSSPRMVRIVKTPLILSRYIHTIKREGAAVSISALPVDNLINILSSIITGIPAIISVHGMPSHNYSKIDKLIKSTVFFLTKKKKTRVSAVSNGVRDELIRLYGLSESQISVIYNPIDISTIQELAKEEELDSRVNTTVPLVVTVGRLNAVKGQWHLIRAFAELRKKQECQLLICGEGPEKDYLSGLIRDLGIEEDVVFLGWQENPYKYMKRATMLVHSSLSESFGNIIVEAMACGCPSVVARCSPAIEEVMGSDSSCGFISEKMSGVRYSATDSLDSGEINLLKGMELILNDEEFRQKMSLACLKWAKEFDLDIGVQKYVELIEIVTGNKNRSTLKNIFVNDNSW